MSDTPRTNAEESLSIRAYQEERGEDWPDFPCDGYDFARVLELELAEVTDEKLKAQKLARDRMEELETWKRLATSAEQYARDFASRNPKHSWRGVKQDPWGVHQWIEEIDRVNSKDSQ